MKNSLSKQGRLDFTVSPKLQTIWGFREATVFALEGWGASLFVASMLLNVVSGMIAGVLLLILAVVLLLSHLGHPQRPPLLGESRHRDDWWVHRLGSAVCGRTPGTGLAYG
jgi:hypothetical protein